MHVTRLESAPGVATDQFNFFSRSPQKSANLVLITGPNQNERYKRLLASNSIETSTKAAPKVVYVAKSNDEESGIKTALSVIVVKGADPSTEELYLEKPGDPLKLRLKESGPEKLGIFLGSSVPNLCAVIRNGEYPGLPLIAQLRSSGELFEVSAPLNHSISESYWAGRAGLVKLQDFFPKETSRAITQGVLFVGKERKVVSFCVAGDEGFYKDSGASSEQALINRMQILIFNNHDVDKNPFLGDTVAAFNLEITSPESH